MEDNYVIEMLGITKEFPGIIANDNITLQLKKGEIHALLGENGAGKSTLMSVLFGLYQPEEGVIRQNGVEIKIKDPNDANKYGIGMVHQHFKLVEVFTALENIILGCEPTKHGFLQKKEARERIIELSKMYGLMVDPDKKISDLTVGQQQRVEILKMLYRNNDILIFDEPTAVLTPQEIDDLIVIMKNLKAEGKSILFITHKLDEIMQVADRVSILRKGKLVGTLEVQNTNKEELSTMMVGRPVEFHLDKKGVKPGKEVLRVEDLVLSSHGHKNSVNHVSFDVHESEIVCIAGIDGNGQTELVYGLTGLEKVKSGHVYYEDKDITKLKIREKSKLGISHIPEDRHKHGLILDYSLEYNLVLQEYWKTQFSSHGWLKKKAIHQYSDDLIEEYDIRSGQGSITIVRSMSGGNQQKAIIAREIGKNPKLLIAVQPTRGLDVGAIENIHKMLINERDKGNSVLLVSLELDEVLNISDRILVMHEGEIVAELDPKNTTPSELGLYMSGTKKMNMEKKEDTHESK